MAVSGGAGAPQWRPEDDADYGRRLLGHVFARYPALASMKQSRLLRVLSGKASIRRREGGMTDVSVMWMR